MSKESFNKMLYEEFVEDSGNLSKTSKKDIKVVHYPAVHRLGIHYGKKSFSFPEEFREIPVVQNVLEQLGDIEVSAEVKTPRHVRSTSAFCKRIDDIGFNFSSAILASLYKTYSKDQIAFLTRDFYGHLLQKGGLSRLSLKLKTDTPYFQKKAKELAEMRNGSGDWELVEIRYHSLEPGFCSLGHKLKWEYIVEERVSNARISFGSHCVGDFFQVGLGIEEQLETHKTALLNLLLEYSLQLNSAYKYNYHIDIWQHFFTDDALSYIDSYEQHERFRRTKLHFKEYLKNRVLVPQYAIYSLLENYPFTTYQGRMTPIINVFGPMMSALVLVGIFGNALINVNMDDYANRIKSKKSTFTNLYGLIASDSSFMVEKETMFGGLNTAWLGYMPQVVGLLRSLRSLDQYRSLAGNLLYMLHFLDELKTKHKFFIKTSGEDVTDITYKGVRIRLGSDGIEPLTVNQLFGYLTGRGSKFSILSTTTFRDMGLRIGSMKEQALKQRIVDLNRLFLSKNTHRGRLEISDLPRQLEPELAGLVALAKKDLFLSQVLASPYIGSVKLDILKEFLEHKLGVLGSEVKLVKAEEKQVGLMLPNYNNRFEIVLTDDILPWTPERTSLKSLGILSKLLSENSHLAPKHLDFPNKVLMTVLSSRRISEKQVEVINKAVNTLASVVGKENMTEDQLKVLGL